MTPQPHKSFERLFQERLKQIEVEAHLVGINMTVVCKEAGIGRATPDRWKRMVPKTIQAMDDLAAVVEKHRQEAVHTRK